MRARFQWKVKKSKHTYLGSLVEDRSARQVSETGKRENRIVLDWFSQVTHEWNGVSESAKLHWTSGWILRETLRTMLQYVRRRSFTSMTTKKKETRRVSRMRRLTTSAMRRRSWTTPTRTCITLALCPRRMPERQWPHGLYSLHRITKDHLMYSGLLSSSLEHKAQSLQISGGSSWRVQNYIIEVGVIMFS
jgi:hypothetical protein